MKNVRRTKKTDTGWKKIFTKHTSSKGPLSNIYKEHLAPKNNKQPNYKTYKRYEPTLKKTYRRHMNPGKEALHHWSLWN